MEQIQPTLDTINVWLPRVVISFCVIVALTLIVSAILKIWEYARIFKEKAVFLEVIPPNTSDRTPEAAQKLFAVLHGTGMAQSWQEKLLRDKTVLSLEVVSSKEQGIRYVLRVPERDVAAVKKHIVAYLPGVKVKTTDDYLAHAQLQRAKIVEFKQSGHFAFPLQPQNTEQDDPISYISTQMTELAGGEQMALQVVAVPARIREADRIAKKVFSNHDLLAELNGGARTPLHKVLDIINSILFGILDGVSDATTGSSQYGRQASQKAAYDKRQVAMRIKPARVLTPAEQQLMESIYDKVRQPLFRADIRAYVLVDSKQEAKQRIKGLKAALAVFNVPKHQSLKARHNFPQAIKSRHRLFTFRHRLPAFFNNSSPVLAASELSDLYHFTTTSTDNTAKSLSRTLPAPISLKNGTPLDVVFGRNDHNDDGTLIGLSQEQRATHAYILGSTGSGKTTMLKYEILQDIKAGRGVAFLDPHGDAAQELLRHIPEERKNDVVYFNPDDLDYPMGLNLLELSPNLSPNDTLRHKELITEATVSIFRKIFSDDDKGGHRIEYLVRNTVQTALTLENPTLFTIFELLNNPQFRKEAVASLENEYLQNFWRYEFAKAGDFQQVKMSAGVTNKVGRFLFSASAERIIGQEKSTIDFDDILNSGKILICNLSKGLLGEDTSELFGTTILAQLQMATLRRARQPEANRKPFYLYVDEFQNFATPSFKQLFSESRKYKVYLQIAQQTTSQHTDQLMVNEILGNVGTIICFRTGSPLDEQYVLPFLDSRIEHGELLNQPAHHFYAKIVAVEPQEPLSGETIQITDDGSDEVADSVIQASRTNYATKYIEKPRSSAKSKKKQQRKQDDGGDLSLDDALDEQAF